MLLKHQKFGERVIDKRIKQRGNIDGILKRGLKYPSVHATNRPWHTSSDGIHMAVNKLGQVAEQAGPVAVKYLNQMRLSELAQKPRKLSTDPSTLDRNGRDSIHGLKNSVLSKAQNRAPNDDTLSRWEKSLTDRQADVRLRIGSALGKGYKPENVEEIISGKKSAMLEQTQKNAQPYIDQYNAIAGRVKGIRGKRKIMKPSKYW